MTETLKILVDIDVKGSDELKGLKGAFSDVDKAASGSTNGIDKASKGFSGLSGSVKGVVAGGLLAAAGAGLVSFGKNAINAASDVEEMQSKFNAVFKDLGGPVTAELQTFADAANRSIYDLQGFAATLQDTFVPLGFARDEAAATSIQLVKLAEDLASFNNLDTADVVNDLQSAMVGNTETLRKYGIVASQSAIDQEALALGLEFTKGQMDAQTKAAAILSITMKSTTDAQGDAIRTSDSYANQLKGLQAAQQELNVELGQVFLPIAAQAVGALTELASGGAEGVRAIKDMTTAASELAAEQHAAAEASQDWSEYGNRLSKTLAENNDLAFHLFGGTKFVLSEMEKAAAAAGDYSGSNEDLARSLEEVFGAEVKIVGNLVQVQGRTIGTKQALEQLNKEYVNSQALLDAQSEGVTSFDRNLTRLATTMETTTAATKNRIQADVDGLDAANLYAEANRTTAQQIYESQKAENLRRIATEESAAAMEAAAAQQEHLRQATAGYFVEALNAGTSTDSLEQQLFDQAAAAGASAESLAVLAGATGLWSEEQVDAALKAAAVNTYIEQQAGAFASGQISLNEYTNSVRNFISEVNNIPSLIETEVRTNYTSSGTPSGPVGKGEPIRGFASGVSDFIVPPGYPNDSYLVGLTSGEMVNVAPSGANTTNNNVGGLTFNVYTSGDNARRDVQSSVSNALRELGIKGF